MDLKSIYRFALICVLAYVVLGIVTNGMGLTNIILQGVHTSQASAAARHNKLSASALESALREGAAFKPNSNLQCHAVTQDWDYVCSYMPTPGQSPTRLQFGVIADATWWREVSRQVPMGADIPPPRR